MKNDSNPLPPGQFVHSEFPRFGMTPFAERFPTQLDGPQITIRGEVESSLKLVEQFNQLDRVEQTSDFHCVTTWTVQSLQWEGYRFSDVYERLIVPLAQPAKSADYITLVGQDGYRSSLPLAALMKADVLLADRLNGAPLSIEHGAPIRLVAPAHYGYKNVKHLKRIELHSGYRSFHPWMFRFMDHPRGRVALEERGTLFPNWLLRPIYRRLIPIATKRFKEGMADYNNRPKA